MMIIEIIILMSQHEKLEIQNIASVLEIGMWKNPDSQITKSALLFLNKQLYEWILSFFLFQIPTPSKSTKDSDIYQW